MSLNRKFDDEACGGDPQTGVGSMDIDLRTEVGFIDGVVDSDGNDLVTMEEIWDDADILLEYTEGRKTFNVTISFYYESALNPPPRSEWNGRYGTISHISDIFVAEKKKRRVVRRILNEVTITRQLKIPYDGLDYRRNNQGRPIMIEAGNADEALITDWMEDNMGFRQTTIFLNQHRVKEERVPAGRSAVMSCFDMMIPKIDRIKKSHRLITGVQIC